MLFRCSVKDESNLEEAVFAKYMGCVAPLEKVDKALKCVGLH